MAAYYKSTLGAFIGASAEQIAGRLSKEVLQRFAGNQQQQLAAWQQQIDLLQSVFRAVLKRFSRLADWGVLLEYPLLRLQRRLDTVALAGQIVAVIEFKVGAKTFEAGDVRQVEDYALDLRDFHQASHKLTIVPVLCATEAQAEPFGDLGEPGAVWPVHLTNSEGLTNLLDRLATIPELASPQIDLDRWDRSPYQPVPTIIQAAELLYAGHSVEEIANAGADSERLEATSKRLVELVAKARAEKRRLVCFVTGVPGSGKTLTGLNLVHDQTLKEQLGVKSAYLSGNTPLVEVLREALARDRADRTGESLGHTRRVVRTEIQHLMDYLREYISANPTHPPFENVVVFDEAQRAWDAAYGKQKFDREASEPALFLEIMGRRTDWSVIVGLVGGGQEINVGEGGLREWGNALGVWAKDVNNAPWDIVAAPDVVFGGAATVGQSLFDQAYEYPGRLDTDDLLHLPIAVRSFRCQAIANWVDHVLTGHTELARRLSRDSDKFPVYVTRDLLAAKAVLKAQARGTRRVGLVASSGARRLRADGLGVSLSANERDAYVHWYLEPKGDIRSSNALEVTANEYTCQGLELDYVGLCWGGDMLWSDTGKQWVFRELSGPRWKMVRKRSDEEYMRNTYRVLMTRARLGMVIWVPQGDLTDPTREPSSLDATARFLREAGAISIGEDAEEVKRVFGTSATVEVQART